jgi:hypothetical protein
MTERVGIAVLRGLQAEGARLDAATCLRRCFGGRSLPT